MSERTIFGDSWQGVTNAEWLVSQPTWDEVANALSRLDARKYTLVTIQGPGEQHLAVGGGSGRYVVYATFDNSEFWNLLGGLDKGEPELLNAGGQEGEYPQAQIVTYEQAREAAFAFFLNLQLEPSLIWVRQP